MPPRPTPFELVFEALARERFPAIQAGLAAAGADARDRDAFLIDRAATTLLHELRPDEGVGEGIDQLAALLHHAYLHWAAGAPVLRLGPEATAALLERRPAGTQTTPGTGDSDAPREAPSGFYAQLAERQLWAQLDADAPHEPLDGCFVAEAPDGALRVLGVFGVHAGRPGFSVAEAAGPEPAGELRRADGTPLFASQLPGGAVAGLHSLAGAEELLELGWRARAVNAPVPGAAS